MNKKILKKSYSFTDFISMLSQNREEDQTVKRLMRLNIMFQEWGNKDILYKVMKKSQSLDNINIKHQLFSEWISLTDEQEKKFKDFVLKRWSS